MEIQIPYLDFITENTQYSSKDVDINNVCTIFAHLQCYAYVKGCGNNIDQENYEFLLSVIKYLCEQEKLCHEMEEFKEAPENILPKYNIEPLNYVFGEQEFIKYNLSGNIIIDNIVSVGYKTQFKDLITKLWNDALRLQINERIAVAFLSRKISMAILFDIKNKLIFIRDSHMNYQYKFNNLTELFEHMENHKRVDLQAAYILDEETPEQRKFGSNNQIDIMVYGNNQLNGEQQLLNRIVQCHKEKIDTFGYNQKYDAILNADNKKTTTKKGEERRRQLIDSGNNASNLDNELKNKLIEHYWKYNKIYYPEFSEYPIQYINKKLNDVENDINKINERYNNIRFDENIEYETLIKKYINDNYKYISDNNINLIVEKANDSYKLLYTGGNYNSVYAHKYLKYNHKYLLAKNNSK